jgi:hypothetical protein
MIAIPLTPLEAGQHVGELHVHLDQRFLHALNRAARVRHQIASLPPQRSRDTDLFVWLETVVQQTEGVQFQQPLAFLNIALAAGQVLGVTGVD